MQIEFVEDTDEPVLKAFKRWKQAIEISSRRNVVVDEWISFDAKAMYGALEKKTTHLRWDGPDLIIRFVDGTEATFTNAWPKSIEDVSDATNFNQVLTVNFDTGG